MKLQNPLTESDALALAASALLAGIIGIWLLYGLFGHHVIDFLYTSQWLQDRIMTERARFSVTAYYERADQIVLAWLLRFLAVFPLFLIIALKPAGPWVFFLVTLSLYASSTAAVGLLGHAQQSNQLHYSYLAEAFWSGRLNIVLTKPEADALSEVVVYGGRCYVLFPPMPAVLLMPLVLLFGKTFPTILLSIGLAAASVSLMYVWLSRAGFSATVAGWVTVLFGFGTSFWYTAVDGSVWWLAQTAGAFFLLLALVEAYGKRRPLLIGLLIGAATLSRLPLVLSTPFFLYLLWQNRQDTLRRAFWMLSGVGLFCALNMLYNWERFGTVSNVAYAMIPEVAYAPWYKNGIFDLRYIPRNIYAILFQPPVLIEHFPYLVPTAFGLALFWTTPALLLAFAAPGDLSGWAVWATVSLLALPSLLHGWPGGAQFGYRFSLDYTPFLMLLTARGITAVSAAKARLAIIVSCVICLWGLRYNTWIEPKWLFDIDRYYRNVHPDEAKLNAACIAPSTSPDRLR